MSSGPPSRIDKYDILSVIGRGGMGIVYKGSDPRIGRPVAIKVMTVGSGDDPEFLKRFYREAQSAGKLQHPNILTIYELGELEGSPYLVMEFIDGENLDRIIRSRRELPLEVKLDLVVQICNGLHYAHERNVVHRDIKPGNIMITSGGTVKIVDFGLAHVGAENLTHPGQVMGSISYMSPEQINGQPVDLRTDIFATGVVLYQLLTYALPFQGADTGSTLLKIIHEPPAALDTYLKLPGELKNVIGRALAKDREARYASAEEFGSDLADILEHLKREKIDQRLEVVQQLIAASELDKASEALSEVLRLDRQDRRASEMMREVRQRIQKRQAQQRAQDLREQAEEAVARQTFDDALLALEEAVKLDDSNAELVHFRDSVQQAKIRAEKIRNALQRAESAQASGELEASLKAVEEVLAIDVDHADARAVHARLTNAIAERDKRKRFQSLTHRAHRQIAAREFQDALAALQEAEQIDSGAVLLSELTRAATVGLEQERCRRQIERFAGEIEDALSHDDYTHALSKVEEALREFPNDRRLQQLRNLTEKQRQAGERRTYIAGQVAAARQLLESGKTADALAVLETACEKYPVEPALQSLRAMVNETLTREEMEHQVAECTQKAKDLVRRNQYIEAIQLLESAKEWLKTTDFDDLIQFIRDEGTSYERRAKFSAITEQANRLISAEEYERAVELLQSASAEGPNNNELRMLLADAQNRLSDFNRSVAEAVAAAQGLLLQRRIPEAVRLLESQPRSFTKVANFSTTLDKAREEVARLQVLGLAKEQAREAIGNENFEGAIAIARACRDQIGDMIDLDLLDNEIKVKRTEVFTHRVQSAVADARTLLIGRSYYSALEILNSVSACVEAVSGELRDEYNFVHRRALRGTGGQEGALHQQAAPVKEPGMSSAPTMLPQARWTTSGAATPGSARTAEPPPALVQGREVNIIGQGDSSSVHDDFGKTLPPGVDEEATTYVPRQTHSALPERSHVRESPGAEAYRASVAALELESANLASPPPSSPESTLVPGATAVAATQAQIPTGIGAPTERPVPSPTTQIGPKPLPRMKVVYWVALVLLAIIAVVGVTRWLGPRPRSMAKPVGYIEIQAVPWATVSEVVSSTGTVFRVNDKTPVRVALPPGDYDVHLTAPDGSQHTSRVHVETGRVSPYRLDSETIDVQKILSAY